MMRRFVNVVVDSGGGGDGTAYKLCRIAAASLFSSPVLPRREGERPGDRALSPSDEVEDAGRLPPPTITFHPSALAGPGNVDFLPLSLAAGDDTLLALDLDGRALLYSAASAALRNMPDPCRPKIAPISFVAADNHLYVIERAPFAGNPGCFEALTYGHLPDDQRSLSFSRTFSRIGWYWRSLPPPPFAGAGPYYEHGRREYDITASAVIHDTELWMSAHGAGTFAFDTVSAEWRKVGQWAMPFKGRGEFVEEYCGGSWLGLSTGITWRSFPGLHLCSSSAHDMDGAPATTCLLDGLDRLPNYCVLMEAYLVNLGSGKLCIARFLDEMVGCSNNRRCLLLTGVDLVHTGAYYGPAVHTSRRYTFHDGDFVLGYSRVL